MVQPGSHLHLPPEQTPFNEQSSSVWQGGGGSEGAGGLGAGGGAGALGIGTGHLPLTSTHPLTYPGSVRRPAALVLKQQLLAAGMYVHVLQPLVALHFAQQSASDELFE